MKLSDDEIETKLAALDSWSRSGEKIERKLQFDGFLDAVAFINRIAELAEAADHHPEIFNVYNRVELVLTTHDADGLTAKDFALAAQIDAVV
jgi:4a-hydroxytetrahydrobiopterin dehydratase